MVIPYPKKKGTMQAFKTEPVNSKGLQECSKISLIKFPASNHAKPRMFTPRGFLKCFPGYKLQLLAATAHPMDRQLHHWGVSALVGCTVATAHKPQGKERRHLFHCAICDPEKVLAGSKDLRVEYWMGGTVWNKNTWRWRSWIFFQKRQQKL